MHNTISVDIDCASIVATASTSPLFGSDAVVDATPLVQPHISPRRHEYCAMEQTVKDVRSARRLVDSAVEMDSRTGVSSRTFVADEELTHINEQKCALMHSTAPLEHIYAMPIEESQCVSMSRRNQRAHIW